MADENNANEAAITDAADANTGTEAGAATAEVETEAADEPGRAEFEAAMDQMEGVEADSGDDGSDDDEDSDVEAIEESDEDDADPEAAADDDGEEDDDAEPDPDVLAGLVRSGMSEQEAAILAATSPELAASIAERHPEPDPEEVKAKQEAEAKAAAERAEALRTERMDKAKTMLSELDIVDGDDQAKLLEIMELVAAPIDDGAVTRMVSESMAKHMEPVQQFAGQIAPMIAAVEDLTFRGAIMDLRESGRYPELADRENVDKVRAEVGKLVKAGRLGKTPAETIEMATALAIGGERALKIRKVDEKKRRAKGGASANVRPTNRSQSNSVSESRKKFDEEYNRQQQR